MDSKKIKKVLLALVAMGATIGICRTASADPCKLTIGHKDKLTGARIVFPRADRVKKLPYGDQLIVTASCDAKVGETRQTSGPTLTKGDVVPAVYSTSGKPLVSESLEFVDAVEGNVKDGVSFTFALPDGQNPTVAVEIVHRFANGGDIVRLDNELGNRYTKPEADGRFAPITGSTEYAPATGSSAYAPASAAYTPIDRAQTEANTSDIKGLGHASIIVSPVALVAFNGAPTAGGAQGAFSLHPGDITTSGPAIGAAVSATDGHRNNAPVPGVPPVETRTPQETVIVKAPICYEIVGGHVVAPLCIAPAVMYQHSPQTSQGQDTSGRVWIVRSQDDVRAAAVVSFGVNAVIGGDYHGFIAGFGASLIVPAGKTAKDNGGTASQSAYGQLEFNLGFK